jgi:hypothetical protein
VAAVGAEHADLHLRRILAYIRMGVALA